MSRIFSISDFQSAATRDRIEVRSSEVKAGELLAASGQQEVNFPLGHYIMRLHVGKHVFYAQVTVYPNSMTRKVMARMSVEAMSVNGTNRQDIFPVTISQSHLDAAEVIGFDIRDEFDDFIERFQYFKSSYGDLDEVAMLRVMNEANRMALDPANELGARSVIKTVMEKRLQIREIFRTAKGPAEASPFID